MSPGAFAVALLAIGILAGYPYRQLPARIKKYPLQPPSFFLQFINGASYLFLVHIVPLTRLALCASVTRLTDSVGVPTGALYSSHRHPLSHKGRGRVLQICSFCS